MLLMFLKDTVTNAMKNFGEFNEIVKWAAQLRNVSPG